MTLRQRIVLAWAAEHGPRFTFTAAQAATVAGYVDARQARDELHRLPGITALTDTPSPFARLQVRPAGPAPRGGQLATAP